MTELSYLTQLRSELLTNSAYVIADATGCIKLDAMESPFIWPGELLAEWQAGLARLQLNRYPEHDFTLRNLLSVELGVKPEQVVMGNGSDELIQLLCMAVAKPQTCVLVPAPSFSMYRIITEACGLKVVKVDLHADFELPAAEMLAAIEQHQPALIFLAVPNNPTGNRFAESTLRQIVAAASGLVVIDEAYCAFAPSHYAAWLNEYPHLVILRTFSKVGLAGIRLGYMAASLPVVQVIERLRLPYNINSLTSYTAEFALQHRHLLQQQSQQIIAWREQLFQQLSALAGVKVWPSHSNFLTLQLQSHSTRAPVSATAVTEQLRQQGVLIKNLHGVHPLLHNCLRVTIGLPEENQKFFTALCVALGV